MLLDRETGERTSASAKAVAVLLVFFGSLILWIAWPLIGEKTRRPDRFLVPAGFEGVLLTVYNQAGFPPLPIEDQFYLHRYPADGILITSSGQEFGWPRNEFFDVLPDGTRAGYGSSFKGPIRHGVGGTGSSRDGSEEIEYLARLAGTEAYWAGRDRREVEKAIEIARERVRKFR